MKNRLPEYWIVKNDGSQLFKDTVIKDLNEISKSIDTWVGKDLDTYYGYDGGGNHNGTTVRTNRSSFINNPTVLTLAEYVELRKPIIEVLADTYSLVYDFTLPEKWVIERNDTNYEIINDWCTKNRLPNEDCVYTATIGFVHSDAGNISYGHTIRSSGILRKGYTPITTEQFKRYVLKEETMEREIIRYKLKPEFDKKQFQKAYCDLVGISEYNLSSATFIPDSYAYNNLKEAGVLDIWFEPVYKEIPEFKIGDVVVVVKDSIGGDNKKGNNSSRRANHIFKISNKIKSGHTHIKEWLYDIEEPTCGISVNLVRHATEEEITKWKEETEFKLPVINGYTGYYHEGLLVWGNNCAIFEPAFFLALKPFVYAISFDKTNRSLQAIRLSSGVEITIAQLEQIINFIEHNIK